MSLYRPKNATVEAWCHDGSRDSAEWLIAVNAGNGAVIWRLGTGLTNALLWTVGTLTPGQWLVKSGERLSIHSEADFRDRYEPVEPGLRPT